MEKFNEGSVRYVSDAGYCGSCTASRQLFTKIKFLERFCIPAPVVGGLLFAIFTCICYVTHILEFSFDDT